MKNIIKLLIATYSLRWSIDACLKYPEGSREYILAKHYKGHFEDLEDKDVNLDQIDILVSEVKKQQLENKESKEIHSLFTNMIKFLLALRSTVEKQ
jgi:transcriptional regulator NrdR family protein